MTNHKFIVVLVVLLLAGGIVVTIIPSKQKSSPSVNQSPDNSGFFNLFNSRNFINLPVLIALPIWPTAAPVNPDLTPTYSPTVIPSITLIDIPSPTSTPTLPSTEVGLTCSGSSTLESLIGCIKSHFGSFVIPSSVNQTDWKTIVAKMLNGQCDFGSPGSLSTIYQVKTFTDSLNGKNYCVAMETQDTNPKDGRVDNGWGTFVVNNLTLREVNQSAPHAVSDADTENQAITLFKSTDSRSFLMSGAIRSIGTSSCQTNLGYSASDASHNIDHFFFAATEVLDSWYGARAWWQIQWHGAAATTCPGVNVYISHGFGTAPPANSMTKALKNNIMKYHPAWSVTVPGDSPSCSLNATNNVEGRLLNGVSRTNVCRTSAASYQYKFIHIEQQPGYRSANDWQQAIIDTFP